MKAKTKRNKRILALRAKGLSFRKIAFAVKISPNRVYQIVEREKKEG